MLDAMNWSRVAIHGPLIVGLPCFWLAWALTLAPPTASARWSLARGLWTLGLILTVVHVLAVFHFIHGWDHAVAVEHTASKVAEMTVAWGFPPWRFGEGLYFNYVFLALWAFDCGSWWWLGHTGYAARGRWLTAIIFAALAFIVIQATVVFGYGLYRWLGLFGPVVLLAWGHWSSRRPLTGLPASEGL